jgi:RHS repeat-associated protein
LTSVSDSTGSGGYGYDTAGLLTNRLVGNRMTSIASRDGEGRPLSITNTVNTLSQLTETLTWSGDGLLATHTLARADFTDPHVYTYASSSRRLVQEQLNLNAGTTWTNTMVYDKGVAAGPGVLTQMGQANGASNEWSSVADTFSRVATETNNTFQYPAYGHVNGQSILLSAWLDNQPVSISGVGTNAMQWRAMMDLAPGTHQLKVSALHPSGFYTAWTTNAFTNSLAYQTTADSYDNAGNITNRVWKNPSGIAERTQTLSWDARGRLHAVTERDASNSGYNWSAVYDPLNRRLQTTTVLVTNGVASTAPAQTINSYFDPQVEFLELGVSYGNQTVWKLYGPDLNGKYGGLNGTGGLDGVSPYLNLFNPVISDFRGNILAEITNGVVSWISARPTGYGAVPGYRAVALAYNVDMAQSSAWRGRWVDITGYHQIGLRPYDSISGRWLTYDSVWNERDPNYYTFAGGDPVNGFDPDGRFNRNYYQAQLNSQTSDFNAWLNNNSTPSYNTPQNSSYDTASTALNIAGIAQFGAEYGSGAASIGINNASGGISLYTHFYGNQSTTAYLFSDIANAAGPYLFAASIVNEGYGVYSGQVSPTTAAINTTVGYIGWRGGPVGAAFAVGYGGGTLINNYVPGVSGAAQTIFQPIMNGYYSPTYQVNYDPNSVESNVNSVANPFP